MSHTLTSIERDVVLVVAEQGSEAIKESIQFRLQGEKLLLVHGITRKRTRVGKGFLVYRISHRGKSYCCPRCNIRSDTSDLSIPMDF